MGHKNRRKKNIVTQTKFPELTISDFETYVSIALDEMVQADRCEPSIVNPGCQPFGSMGLRDEGFGVVVRLKDGSSFVLKIKPLSELDNVL